MCKNFSSSLENYNLYFLYVIHTHTSQKCLSFVDKRAYIYMFWNTNMHLSHCFIICFVDYIITYSYVTLLLPWDRRNIRHLFVVTNYDTPVLLSVSQACIFYDFFKKNIYYLCDCVISRHIHVSCVMLRDI